MKFQSKEVNYVRFKFQLSRRPQALSSSFLRGLVRMRANEKKIREKRREEKKRKSRDIAVLAEICPQHIFFTICMTEIRNLNYKSTGLFFILQSIRLYTIRDLINNSVYI